MTDIVSSLYINLVTSIVGVPQDVGSTDSQLCRKVLNDQS